MKFFKFCFLFLFPYILCSQNFNTYLIPDSLKENANVVVRLYEENVTFFSENEIIVDVKQVVTILNEEGKKYSVLDIRYDPNIKIIDINGKIYNNLGIIIKKIKFKDFADIGSNETYSLFTDDRHKVFALSIQNYPITVEYNYKYKQLTSFYTPTYTPYLNSDFNISVEKSRFQVSKKVNHNVKFYLINTNKQPSEEVLKDIITWTWSFSNLKAIKNELFSPSTNTILPIISVVSQNFTINKKQGSFENWNVFGKWIYEINYGRDKLPQKTIEEVLQLVKNVEDTIQKAKLIYEYMQNKTRYVSIQIGIGSWQPFLAADVDNKGYGDCKALSNYTIALLKVAGIKANYCLVAAGQDNNKFKKSYIYSQFNHAIVCLPLQNDTIFLECTNQKIPFGYLSDFTDDRDVLLIDENGGKIIHTTNYKIQDNVKRTYNKFVIYRDAKADVTMKIEYNGLFYDDISSVISYSKEDQKKWIYDNIQLSDFNIKSFEIIDSKKSRIPQSVIDLKININSFGRKSANSIIFNTIYYNRFFDKRMSRNRENNIEIRRAICYADIFEYEIPEGYKPDFIPNQTIETCKYGSFEYTFIYENGKIIVNRNLKIYKGFYDKKEYEEFSKFIETINKIENQQIIISK